MPRKFRMFIVRHAESEANKDLAINQRKPDHAIELTDNGYEQADKVGEFLKQYISENIIAPEQTSTPFIRLWSSPYERTRKTSQGIINALGIRGEDDGGLLRDYREKDCLREQDFGIFEGMTKEECAENFPEENKRYVRAKEWKGQYWAKMPQGESRAEVSQRVLSFISTIMRDTTTNDTRPEEVRNVIVVTHGVTARCLVKEFLNKEYEWVQDEPNPDNASVRLIEDGIDKGYIFEGYKCEANKAKKPSYLKRFKRLMKTEFGFFKKAS